MVHRLLREAIPVSSVILLLECYADLRRGIRLPHGAGLIGDIVTLTAATAPEYGLIVVMGGSDFTRVPDPAVKHLPRGILI
jgi:predicted nucleic acid-binding protein